MQWLGHAVPVAERIDTECLGRAVPVGECIGTECLGRAVVRSCSG